MDIIHLNMVQTLAIAALVYFVGASIKSRTKFCRRFFIPAPVIGGILASLLVMIMRKSDFLIIDFDVSLQSLFMTAFFTTVGFMASIKLMARSGITVAIMLLVSAILLISQNFIGCSLSTLFGLDPKFGLVLGSVALTGGHGTVGAFGATIEELGVTGAQTAGFAAATYGLIVGCLIGGPVAAKLMAKYKIKGKDDKSEVEIFNEEPTRAVVGTDISTPPVSSNNLMLATVIICISMGIGSLVALFVKAHSEWIMEGGLSLPIYIGPMLVAALIRNITDLFNKNVPMIAIDALGNVCLNVFLSMAMMSMKLWELVDLALPIIAILIIQTFVVLLFVYFVTYNVMKIKVLGSKYDAVVMCSGHCGFAMGATPTAIANMTSFCEVHGFSTKAFFVIPLIGTLFIDFINATVISLFINFL